MSCFIIVYKFICQSCLCNNNNYYNKLFCCMVVPFCAVVVPPVFLMYDGWFLICVFLCLCIMCVTDSFDILLDYFDLCKDLLNVNKNSNSNEHCLHHLDHYRSFLYVVALLSHLEGTFFCVMEGIATCLLTRYWYISEKCTYLCCKCIHSFI
jgi:hypothetical protein